MAPRYESDTGDISSYTSQYNAEAATTFASVLRKALQMLLVICEWQKAISIFVKRFSGKVRKGNNNTSSSNHRPVARKHLRASPVWTLCTLVLPVPLLVVLRTADSSVPD